MFDTTTYRKISRSLIAMRFVLRISQSSQKWTACQMCKRYWQLISQCYSVESPWDVFLTGGWPLIEYWTFSTIGRYPHYCCYWYRCKIGPYGSDPFRKQFLSSSLKSCKNSIRSNVYSNDSIRSYCCTCDDTCAVVICMKPCHDLIIIFQHFQLWAHKPFVKWVKGHIV